METFFKTLKNNKILKILMAVSVIMSLFTVCAYADGVNPLQEAGLSGSSGPLSKLYNFFFVVSIPLGAVGLAMCGFAFFTSNEKSHSEAKKRIMYIGIALAILALLPTFFKFTFNVNNVAWKPEGGNMVFIEPANPDVDIPNFEDDGEDGDEGEEENEEETL